MLLRLILATFISIVAIKGFSQRRVVKKRTEASIGTYKDFQGNQKIETKLKGFVSYDKKGREIANGTYGQSYSRQTERADGGFIIACGKDYSKLKSVNLMTYDKKDRKIKTQSWEYSNNVKSNEGYTITEYNSLSQPIKEMIFSEEDSLWFTRTYFYDTNFNNIQLIDSIRNFGDTNGSFSIHKTINVFDSQQRIIKSTEIVDEKVRKWKRYQYSVVPDLTTELHYENQSDSSLWLIIETKYGLIENSICSRMKLEETRTVVNTKFKRKIREVFTYNKDCLLEAMEEYQGDEKIGYYTYTYQYYKRKRRNAL